MGKRRNLGQLHPLDDEIRAHLIRRLILKMRKKLQIFAKIFKTIFLIIKLIRLINYKSCIQL